MKTVLVIDDDRAIVTLIVKSLERKGYQAIGCCGARKGITRAMVLKPDLILCDVVMPDISGYEVLTILRSNPGTQSIPLMFLTSKSNQRDVMEGLALGADNYLSKPIDTELLLATVAARFADLDESPAKVNSWSKPGIHPDLLKEYQGWWAALEPETNRCFLGKTREMAYKSALRASPTGLFLYQQLGNGPQSNPKKTILVIDDDQAIVTLIVKSLERQGHHVIGCCSPKKGITWAMVLKPDLILCDVVMPDISGYEVLTTLRRNSVTRSIPLMFLTCKSSQRDVMEGLALGADNYLSKPIDTELLLATVEARFADLDDSPSNVNRGSKADINPDLVKKYRGWWAAVEPATNRCFLGKTREMAYKSALRANPTGVFLYQKLDKSLESHPKKSLFVR